jgi:hypothetical protein
MTKHPKLPVSERAVIQRINRKLKSDNEMVRKARGSARSLGEYYVIDFNRNWITGQNVDIEELARELGVLREWETVEERQDG